MKRLKLLFCVAVLASVAVALTVHYRTDAAGDPEYNSGMDACPMYPVFTQIFLSNAGKNFDEASRTTVNVANNTNPLPTLGLASRANFIDDYIFDAMASEGITPAELAGDAEFLRRVYLDTTGRIPPPDVTKQFLASTDPNKRTALIEQLLASDAFIDRMTLLYGDLLRNTIALLGGTAPTAPVEARNAYYNYIRQSLSGSNTLDGVLSDLLTATGLNTENGASNFLARERIGNNQGGVLDSLDEMAISTARVFLGTQIQCISCHNGARHLEEINLWLSNKRREDLWGMAAFFSSVNVQALTPRMGQTLAQPSDVEEGGPGYYDTRMNGGSLRPARTRPDPLVYPKYIRTDEEVVENYRSEFVRLIKEDPQFAKAGANYIWKWFMGLGIVDPPYAFDFARQDPNNPPPAPWTIQPTNPDLLQALADDFTNSGFDIRSLVYDILTSSTYQLSAYYNGTWQDRYAKFFARHLVRRLSSEQIHDAITQASDRPISFQIPGLNDISWAVQLPDTAEPINRTGFPAPAGTMQLLNTFDRGNRNTVDRPDPASGSLFQALFLMNNNFVISRIKANQPSRVRTLLQDSNLTDDQVVEELYLATLTRYPTPEEKATALGMLSNSRSSGAEDLAWTLLNKLDFIHY
jgi:hypothetical protein